jgi:hypothetical protein
MKAIPVGCRRFSLRAIFVGSSLLLLGTAIALAIPGEQPQAPEDQRSPLQAPAPRAAKPDGKELFAREWIPGDPRSHRGDGLGPVFNDTSCIACHNQGGAGGGGPASKNVHIVSTAGFAHLSGFSASPRPAQSFVLHHFGTDDGFATWRGPWRKFQHWAWDRSAAQCPRHRAEGLRRAGGRVAKAS